MNYFSSLIKTTTLALSAEAINSYLNNQAKKTEIWDIKEGGFLGGAAITPFEYYLKHSEWKLAPTERAAFQEFKTSLKQDFPLHSSRYTRLLGKNLYYGVAVDTLLQLGKKLYSEKKD